MHCRNCKKKLSNKVINIGKQCISSVFPEKIKNNLKKYINLENKPKSYAVSIKSNKQIRTTSKDKKGNAKTLEYKISVQMVFSDLDNKYEKTFEETFGYQNRSNKFNLKRYENDIQNNLIEKIVFDINQFLYQLEK